jgi:hypothetical protein
MTRATSLVIASVLLPLAACVIGDPTMPPPGQGDDVDAGASGRDDGGGGGGGMDGGGSNNQCENIVSPAPDGHHNPGQACLASGCHDGTGVAPRYFLAGTLYTSAAGTAPRPGAHMIIPTGVGNPLKLTVASNGNFWTETSMTVSTRPKASGCPNLVQMPTTTTDGNCNKSGCHASGNRIALPL